MNKVDRFLVLLSLALLNACSTELSNEEIGCFAWKDSGGAYISDNLVFGTNPVTDLSLHSDRRITLHDSLIGVVAHASSTELVVRLPSGKEAEFRKLVRTCKP
jgi:hypothetical protein